MRTTRLVGSWSAIVLISGVAGCAATTQHAADGLRADASLFQTTPEERRQLRDSAVAQTVADEVGPRVTVSADFDYAGGSRRVDARFHMYDDAYVIVGHLDASGRLKVVFPSEPGDDGFVRGDKIYHVPSFFAGFGDEYSWAYSNYRYRYHSYASRRDSYDAGLGYVFVIASWRPMRLDRITDGNHWLNYEISDVNYMSDPREAIEELGSLIAGDNREAYTIEYARYSTTNYGTYAYSDFDLVNSGCYNSLGYNWFGPLFYRPFGFSSFGYGSGCSPYGLGYSSYFGYGRPVVYSPLSPAPIIPRVPTVPIGAPIFHGPRSGDGTVALHRPRNLNVPVVPVNPGATITVNGNSQYRRPGLIAEDAPTPRGRGQSRPSGFDAGFTSSRPTIQQMIGGRRIEPEPRGASIRDAGVRDNSSWPSRSGMGAPRSAEQGGRWSDGATRGGVRETGRSYGSGSGTQAHAPARGETARSAPPSPRSEPAARSAPHASSGSSTKKP